MKGFWVWALLAAVVSTAPQLYERDISDDDDCSMVWVTVYTDALPSTTAGSRTLASTVGSSGPDAVLPAATSSKPTTVGSISSVDTVDGGNETASTTGPLGASDAASSLTTSSAASTLSPSSPSNTAALATASGSSALDTPTRPDGSAPFPVNNDHLSAPVATDAVPAGAATYTPAKPGVFDNTDFAAWMKKQKDADLASKWMKVAPGSYRYAPGPVMPSGTDANTVVGENIAIGFMTGGWTLDLRDVTFYIDVTPQNQNQRPSDMIYINQSEDFTILGGTVWVDQGEEWTQARIKSLSAADDQGNQIATIEVEQGYNVSAWRAAGPRNQGCVDDSDSTHFTRPGCNFWYVSKYDFSDLDSKHTFTASIASRAGIEEGYVLVMVVVENSSTTISTEDNGNFHVKGFTSNGYVASIGLNGKKAPVFEDVYYVNPPPRPGYAPRVQGPAVSWSSVGGPVYNPPGQPLAEMPGSVWQATGCEKDLQSASNGTVPN